MLERGEGARRRFDLHLHSNASDGLLPPEKLVEWANEAGLVCIAVTDHDTTQGIPRALEAGARLGFPVITGAEFAAAGDAELHILGYGMDIGSAPWLAFTAEQQRRRAERNGLMMRRLHELGLTIPEEYRPARVRGEYGRMHVARGLVAAGHAGSVQQAFDRFLGAGRPAHVRRRKFSAPELIAAIGQAGGKAVLAHPGRLGLAGEGLEELVASLAAQGLAGIEAYYPSHTREASALYRAMALRHGLVCTYGSDWHGAEPAGLAFGFDDFDIGQETFSWLTGLIGRQEDLHEGR